MGIFGSLYENDLEKVQGNLDKLERRKRYRRKAGDATVAVWVFIVLSLRSVWLWATADHALLQKYFRRNRAGAKYALGVYFQLSSLQVGVHLDRLGSARPRYTLALHLGPLLVFLTRRGGE